MEALEKELNALKPDPVIDETWNAVEKVIGPERGNFFDTEIVCKTCKMVAMNGRQTHGVTRRGAMWQSMEYDCGCGTVAAGGTKLVATSPDGQEFLDWQAEFNQELLKLSGASSNHPRRRRRRIRKRRR